MPDTRKYIDSNGLLYLWQKIKTMLAGKVNVESGKGLSTNDFTDAFETKLTNLPSTAAENVIESISVNNVAQTVTSKNVNITVPAATSDLTNDSNFAVDASYVHTDNNYTTTEKTKLGGIEAGAEVNVLESISVNGTAQTITSKGVNITVPTNNNQLTNGAGYQTASDVSNAISSAIGNISGVEFSIVQTLPATGAAGIIYLISNGSSSGQNIYDEYVYVNNGFEKIGTTDVDLSGYMQNSNYITNAEIDTILAS